MAPQHIDSARTINSPGGGLIVRAVSAGYHGAFLPHDDVGAGATTH
jgi:hypothetical protein